MLQSVKPFLIISSGVMSGIVSHSVFNQQITVDLPALALSRRVEDDRMVVGLSQLQKSADLDENNRHSY